MLPRSAVAFLIFLSSATAASGQDLERFRIQVDNDWFQFWRPPTTRPDDNYTHGSLIRTVFNRTPQWARFGRLDCSGARQVSPAPTACVQSFASVTQLIFTPTHSAPMPLRGERPYAGLLTGEFGVQLVRPRRLRTFGVSVGTTGSYSLAAASQRTFHRLGNSRQAYGWDYQVEPQPVLGAMYGQHYLLTPPRVGRSSAMTVAAQGSVIATTIQSGLDAGLEIHAGYNVPHPWMPLSSSERHRFRAYAILGAKESWVARNLLVEGNSPYTRGLVVKKPFVFESVFGLAAGVGGYFAEYRAVSISRDYETAPSWHRWGTISFIIGTP